MDTMTASMLIYLHKYFLKVCGGCEASYISAASISVWQHVQLFEQMRP